MTVERGVDILGGYSEENRDSHFEICRDHGYHDPVPDTDQRGQEVVVGEDDVVILLVLLVDHPGIRLLEEEPHDRTGEDGDEDH